MTEKRFEYIDDDLEPLCKDNENDGEVIHWKKVVDLLNEQQAIIEAKDSLLSILSKENEKLRQQLKEKEEDERLYANEIVELRKTNEEWLQFKDLGGDY